MLKGDLALGTQPLACWYSIHQCVHIESTSMKNTEKMAISALATSAYTVKQYKKEKTGGTSPYISL